MDAAAPDDAKVGTPFGEQRLADYLRSWTAELVLHGMDLAVNIDAPPEALVECGCFLLERAVKERQRPGGSTGAQRAANFACWL